MKQLFTIIFLVLLGGGICAQPALEEKKTTTKSALAELDEWHQKYWKNYENKTFDEALACFAPTAVVVENGTMYRYNDLKEMHARFSQNIIKMEVSIDSCSIELLDNNHAAIQAFCFGNQKTKNHDPYCMRFSYLMLVEKEQDDWQIQSVHEDVNYCPLIYATTLPANRRNGQIGQDLKFYISMNHMYLYMIQDLIRFKELGLSVEERAKELGELVAQSWDADISFPDFCRVCIRNSQAFTTQAELVEHTDDLLKIRYFKNYKSRLSDAISDEEVQNYWLIINRAIADKVGVKIDVDDEGDYYTATIRRNK